MSKGSMMLDEDFSRARKYRCGRARRGLVTLKRKAKRALRHLERQTLRHEGDHLPCRKYAATGWDVI